MTLLAQHEEIRWHLEQCAALAVRFKSGADVDRELEDALRELRREVEVHNEAENALIRVLLVRSARWGSQLIDRMVEEHSAEHAAFWTLLTGSVDEVATRISELNEQLDAHMAAEERTFLAPHVLRDDVIDRHRQ